MQGLGLCKSKVLLGTVVNKSGRKTIRVIVRYTRRHDKYPKTIKRVSKFIVHDELEKYRSGDSVSFVGCRPLSALKRFRVLYPDSGSV